MKKTLTSLLVAASLLAAPEKITVARPIECGGEALHNPSQQKSKAEIPSSSQAVEDYIQANKERWLREDFEPFIRMECTSAKEDEDLSQKTACAAYLEDLIIKKGLKPKVFIGKETPKKEILKNPIQTDLERIRPVVYFEWITDPSLPTILFDTHYDRRPRNDNPADPWVTDPFEPVRKKVTEEFGGKTITDERIFGRGTDDSIGHLLPIVWGLEAYEHVHRKLPINVKVMFEGAEEIGSPGMDQFVIKYKDMLKADFVVIADTPTNTAGIPIIYTRLRGALDGEICVRTARKEIHSGNGSYVPNALGILSSVMSKIENPLTKKVMLTSYTAAAKKPTLEEIAFVNNMNASLTNASIREKYGILHTVGTPAISPAVQTILYPSWDWQLIPQGKNGGEGVIPSYACVLFMARLVRGQDPQAIMSELEQKLQHLPEARYATITSRFIAGVRAFQTDLKNPYAPLVIAALKKAFMTDQFEEGWDGASEPIASYFQTRLGVPGFLIGYGSPQDNPHVTNESMLADHGLMLGVRGNMNIIEKATMMSAYHE